MHVFSHYQTTDLLAHRSDIGKVIKVSADLGRTLTDVTVHSEGIALTDALLTWDAISIINNHLTSCYTLQDNEIEKIGAFSEETGRVYTLYPTQSAPTMLVSGLSMHRIKNSNPFQDTLEKVKAIRPVIGRVLDTTTGLGYTAIEAARTATDVITVEIDPAAQQIVAANPWSSELKTAGNIEQKMGDSFDVVQTFDDGIFQRIIHDPPMFSHAGALYSATFYTHLYRILAAKGTLFHYIGNPESHSGARTTRGVIERLKAAGFRRVVRRPQAFGVVAMR